jgi:polyhydroxyalkanoate synthesis regulator phasin
MNEQQKVVLGVIKSLINEADTKINRLASDLQNEVDDMETGEEGEETDQSEAIDTLKEEISQLEDLSGHLSELLDSDAFV